MSSFHSLGQPCGPPLAYIRTLVFWLLQLDFPGVNLPVQSLLKALVSCQVALSLFNSTTTLSKHIHVQVRSSHFNSLRICRHYFSILERGRLHDSKSFSCNKWRGCLNGWGCSDGTLRYYTIVICTLSYCTCKPNVAGATHQMYCWGQPFLLSRGTAQHVYVHSCVRRVQGGRWYHHWCFTHQSRYCLSRHGNAWLLCHAMLLTTSSHVH